MSGAQRARARNLAEQHRRERRARVLADEQPPADQHLPQHHADREQIAAPVERLAVRLLGAHVRGLALDEHRRGRLARVPRLRDAEVGDLDRAFPRQQHVVRRHVAMDDAAHARCRSGKSCAWPRPRSTSLITKITTGNGSSPLAASASRSLPSTSSMTRNSRPSASRSKSSTETMFGCDSRELICASATNICANAGLSEYPGSTRLIATRREKPFGAERRREEHLGHAAAAQPRDRGGISRTCPSTGRQRCR